MNMNKILMDGEKLSYSSESNIEVNGNCELQIRSVDKDIVLNIIMNDNSNLTILDFNANAISKKVKVIQKNNSYVKYIHSFKIVDNYDFEYIANIEGNNNKNDIIIKGVTSGKVNIYVDGIASKNTKNNELNEDIKVLNMGGKVFTSPMLHVSCLDIIANHNTAISNIRKDELFYLNSKGISDVGAIRLISDAYTYGLFKEYEEFYNLIK